MNIDKIIQDTIQHEAGFTNNPNDNGNWTGGKKDVGFLKGTKYGISAMTYPTVDIVNLTIEQATEIYKKDFWGNLGLLSSEKVASKVFDIGVNMGQSTPIRFLQKIASVKEDGIMGTQTANVINSMNESDVLTQLRKLQILRYVSIVKKNPSQIEFLEGWINRAFV